MKFINVRKLISAQKLTEEIAETYQVVFAAWSLELNLVERGVNEVSLKMVKLLLVNVVMPNSFIGSGSLKKLLGKSEVNKRDINVSGPLWISLDDKVV